MDKAQESTGEKKLGKKGIIAIIVSAVLLVGITVGIIVAATINNSSFNYKKKNMSKYVYVPEELYKSFNVTVDIPEVTDNDINEEVLKLLCAYKIVPDEPVLSYPYVNGGISAGDVVNLYYRGYTEENGVKTYFDGGCNFGDTYTALEIGSGTFIPGFESGLIGENDTNNKKSYATLTKANSGVVRPGDIISITYSVTRANGDKALRQTTIIDLSDPTIDQRWGDGFSEYILGKQINESFATGSNTDKAFLVPTVCEGWTGTDTYIDMKINVACRVSNGEKLVVEGKFPADYKDSDLAGKTGYFEVYISDIQDYQVFDFDDTFITTKLNVKAEDLASFSGTTLAEKYKDYIRRELENQRQSKINILIEDTFWNQALALSEFKQIPEREVDKYYASLVANLQHLFDNGYADYFNADFDAFVRYYFSLNADVDWKVYVRNDAIESVKRKLILYYIAQVEKLEPSEEEYNSIYEYIFADHLQDYLKEYDITESLPNYATLLEQAKKEVKAAYGEAYFDELVLYDYVMTKLATRAVLITK